MATAMPQIMMFGLGRVIAALFDGSTDKGDIVAHPVFNHRFSFFRQGTLYLEVPCFAELRNKKKNREPTVYCAGCPVHNHGLG